MKNREHLYVSNKNVLTWLMVLCMVGSVVTRFMFPSEKGIGAWDQIVLPVAACLLFALVTLCSGKKMYYKTALAVWLYAIYYCFILCNFPYSSLAVMIKVLYVIAMMSMAIAYSSIIANHGRLFWLMVPVLLFPLCAQLYLYAGDFRTDYRPFISDILMTLGMIAPLFGVHFHTDGKYYPTWGDRSDGRKIRTLAPMAQITSFFQVERNTCSNLFEESIEITHIERYIRQKRKEGLTDFGITHVLLAAYIRGLCKYPQLNRFINGQKVYSRGNDIQYCMVIKKTMSVESPDTSFKVHLHPGDTAEDVYNKMNEAVKKIKATQELDSNLDSLIMTLNLIPSVVLKFVVWLLKLLDYFGLLPRFLLELSPFHGSLFFTSMGSLGIPPIYHHLYDFGNLPCFGAFGCKRRATEVQEDGTLVQRKYVDMKFVLDERIVDGFYYATFFKYYRRLLAHPEVLDNPPETIEKDID